MEKLEQVEVNILKMRESSGNEQFFVRLVRNDKDSGIACNDGVLEYACFQTKHLSKDECLQRAWFSASFAARFIGLKTMKGVILINCDEEETTALKASMSILHEKD